MGTLTTVASALIASHPADAANVVARMGAADAAVVLSAAGTQGAADVLVRMPPRIAVECLASMTEDEATEILDLLSASVAASLLRGADPALAKSLLKNAAYRNRIEEHLRYSTMSVGEAMDSEIPAVPDHWTVAETLSQLGQVSKASCPYLYVMNPSAELVGVLRAEDLNSRDNLSIGQVMTTPVTSLRAASPLESVLDDPAWTEYDVLPVTGRKNLLVGILRHKDIRRHGAGSTAILTNDESIADLVLSLGELYWENLWRVVDSFAPPTHQPPHERKDKR